MKNKFPEYYKPADKEFEELWENCIFIVDTSVLLNLYEYSAKSRDEFLSILNKISNRLWIPYQVGKEYHSRRPHIIREQKENYHKIQEKIEATRNKLISDIDTEKSIEYHPFIDKKELIKKIDELFSKITSYLNECETKYPDLTNKDNIGEEIDRLFENKIGDEYSREKLKELYDTGKKRYEQKIPPGFSDQQKGNEKQYGDFISWIQILEYAKVKNQPVVFITDDEKNDWWLIHDYQRPTQEIILPHPRLIKEFVLETNNRFYMYNSENFIKAYSKFLKEKVSNHTIKEVRNLRDQQVHQSLWAQVIPTLDQEYLKNLNQYDELQKQFQSHAILDMARQSAELQKHFQRPEFLEMARQQEELQKYFQRPEFLEMARQQEELQKYFQTPKYSDVKRKKTDKNYENNKNNQESE